MKQILLAPKGSLNVTNLNSLERTHSYQIKPNLLTKHFQTFGAYNWSQGHNGPV